MKKVLLFTTIALLVVLTFGSAFAVELTMYSSDESKARVLRQVVELYQEEHPDVKIEVVAFPYANYMQKMSLVFLGGEPPDLLETTATYLPQMTQFLRNVGPDIEENLGLSPQEYKDSTYDVVKVYLGEEDIVHAVPLHFTTYSVWINKEMFEKAGIAYPPKGGRTEPWTWEEFKDVLRKVKSENATPYAMSIEYSADKFFSYLALWNIKILDEEGNFVMDQYENAEKAINEFVDLFKEELVPPAEWLSGESHTSNFFGGITAVDWAGSWMARESFNAEKQNDVAPCYVPVIEDWFGISGGGFLAAPQTGDAEKEKAATDFVMWIADKDKGYTEYIKRSRDLSAYKDHSIDYGEPLLDEWAEVHQVLAERAPAWSTEVRATAVWSRLTDTIRKDLALGISESITAQEMIQHWKEEAQRILSEL